MVNFDELANICHVNSTLASAVIDDFLMYYSGHTLKFGKLANKNLGVYKHITNKHKDWLPHFKSQYIVHHIFKKGGIGRKLINHSTVKEQLNQKEIAFFQQQLDTPWRFSFSIMIDNPNENFFQMLDIFTGEEFLLNSPGIQDISNTNAIHLWLNLIQFNGSCWQSFGPIGSYNSFDADDIYFFASELDPSIQTEEQILAHIEKDPAPYMMLFVGSRFPAIFHKEFHAIHMLSVYDDVNIDLSLLEKHFEVEFNSNIYRFTDPELYTHPHFAVAYYSVHTDELIFEAMTRFGFEKLINQWNKLGYNFSTSEDLCVNPSMLTTIETITREKPILTPYAEYFETEVLETENKELDKINEFLQLVLSSVNSGQKPDVTKLAKKVGLDESIANDVFNQTFEKLKDMQNKYT